nr:TonB-dependent receptor [Methylosinus sp. PW1]
MRFRIGCFKRRALSAVSLAPIALVAASFQSNSAGAEEAKVADVVVGASSDGLTRQEEKVLLKTPRSAAIVNGKVADEELLVRLSDFQQLVPNYRPNVSNPQTSTPAIRGVGVGAGTGSGAESDTGFILDNVFWKNVGFQWGDYVDVESFEVGLGPQGTAYGKNTTVGNIIVRTQRPSFERKATIETSFGAYNQLIQRGNITGPIIDDRLAYRVGFYIDKGDGWIRDQVTGAGYLNNDRWGVRGQLLFVGDEVTDRLIFSHSVSHDRKWGTGSIGDSVLLYANGTRAAAYSRTLFNRLGRSVLTFDPYKPYVTGEGAHQADVTTVSNEVNWTLGENTLTSISAWGYFANRPHNSRGENLTEITDSHGNGKAVQVSQELRFASAPDQPLEWVVGLLALYEKVWSYNELDFGSDAARWFGTPTTDPALLWGFTAHADGQGRTFHMGEFGQTTYHFDDRWSLTFGLRDSFETKEGSNFGWLEAWSSKYAPLTVYNAARGAGGQGAYDTGGRSVSRNMLTGVFNPSFKYSDNVTFWGLVGRGEKAAAINTSARPILIGTTFKGFQPLFTRPESNWDYELGVKTNWLDGALIANFNVYWTDLFNFQANQVDTSYTDATGQPIRQTYLGSVPHVRLRGFEFTGRWNPLERLWFSFNGSFTDARYVDFPNAAPPADWTWPTPSSAPAGFVAAPLTLSLSNSRWQSLPKWAFNIGANYSAPIGAPFAGLGGWAEQPLTAFGYANLAWQDKTQLTNRWSTLQYWQPAYSIVNAGVGLRTDDERYSLNVWAKNIFDARYITAWSPGDASTPANVALLQQPRTFGGTLRIVLQ